MNKINPKKLLNSKWTAVKPTNKEKHFLVTEIEFDEEGVVISCSIEAVMSKRVIPINWHDLKDECTGQPKLDTFT
ncbi:TIGR02450 family Trp-rich protein [Shewanella baltica]|uniref:TIGR02450 family Trp-rich protein n=1 Tax=Shewanella baltica TaxID=62322 RepID=UPI00217E824E|nr:TIGR02450 family Trp-rich protein [Shewanella baltica]MCS6151805.1 TIGR02450 family Trp-rich protein [Shewanella baltica]